MSSKRAFDLVVAVPGAIVALPIVLLLCLLIVVIDRHNPLFIQRRLGRNETPFTMYKLRTMKSGTEQVPTHEVAASRVSRLGLLLRATKLDELPQLLSVIKGDMSLVGPRPGLTDHDALTVARRSHGVFDLAPGITGVSQMERIDMSDPERLAASDARYIGQASLATDFRIILATILGKGGGDRVER